LTPLLTSRLKDATGGWNNTRKAERVLSLELSKGSEDRIGFDVVDAGDAEAVRLDLTLAQRGGDHVVGRDRQGWKRLALRPARATGRSARRWHRAQCARQKDPPSDGRYPLRGAPRC
jgi:hypothetical protein